MQDAERERQDEEGSALMAGSLLMDDDESGNEEEKPAFWEGKGRDAGRGHKADYFMDARQELMNLHLHSLGANSEPIRSVLNHLGKRE